MKHIFLLLFPFLPLFLVAQEKGMGLNFHIEPTYKLLKTSDTTYDVKTKGVAFSPIFYIYKMKNERHRMNELGLHIKNISNGLQSNAYANSTYGRQLRFLKQLNKYQSGNVYDANVSHFNAALNYLHFLPIAKFDELEFWLGLRASLSYDYQYFQPVTSAYIPLKTMYILSQFGVVPTVTYKLNDKITLDARWIPRFWLDAGLNYTVQRNPVVPIPNQSRLLPILDLRLCTFQANFEIGAKYTINTETSKQNKSSKKVVKSKKK